MITQKEFDGAIAKFDATEKRGTFYDMVVKMIGSGFETEAYLFLMATWNFAAFRYAIKDFDINGFSKLIISLKPYLKRLNGECLEKIDFDRYKPEVTKIYALLSKIKGIGFTGASKIMHLANRNVFVMWDDYIGGRKSKKYYAAINMPWKHKKYPKDANGYFQFLKDMQVVFRGINYPCNRRTFAKAVDEFNYSRITMTIQALEKKG